MNSDGLPDIVVASHGISNATLSFLFQEPDGALGAENVYSTVPIEWDSEVHVADMNSDGRNDIVVQSGPKQLAVIKQTAPGIYSATPDYYMVQTSYWPNFCSFALGDLTGDGRTDIAVADPGNGGYLNLFLQNSAGSLIGPKLINFTDNTQDEIKIADINGDGWNDILFLSGGDRVMVLMQSTVHIFKTYHEYFLPTESFGGTSVHRAMSIGDVTGDGLTDVIASWSDEGIFVLPRR
jgi:hypothetical protein